MLQSIIKAGFMVVACMWGAFANAGAITCLPSNERVATLDDAVLCATRNGPNANISTPADVDALIDDLGFAWVKEGEITAPGSNDLFKVSADSWGTDVNGMWYIDASFWTMYSRAVISMHVGEGGGNPDAFAWLITPGEVSGTFSYERVAGKGGGLSNLFLWGSGTPKTSVSEPNIAILLLLGLISVFAVRRRT
ncbi:hypothetical protein [Cellvibrio sp. PSBB023]|uniref:hypothetical protein n=1 Tax=Cellvibrio sp. PSBB023 TaxID=1945512 RepID=UPI0009902B80|nr:hypothetical protein [Cellvibrio sp. PSBB023]AQT58924.1 hypothetical protein B0D95_01565 [Cellvibrio sp. PSBB023]